MRFKADTELITMQGISVVTATVLLTAGCAPANCPGNHYTHLPSTAACLLLLFWGQASLQGHQHSLSVVYPSASDSLCIA